MDKNGYLVNSAGEYLNGWSVDPTTGVVNQHAVGADPGHADRLQPGRHRAMSPCRPTCRPRRPPARPLVLPGQTSTMSLGTAHTVDAELDPECRQNDWTVIASDARPMTSRAPRSAPREVTFGTNGSAGGTVGTFGTVSGSGHRRPAPARRRPGHADVRHRFRLRRADHHAQPRHLSAANGVTQFAGSAYSLRGLTQDGVPPGSFAGITTTGQRRHRGELRQRPVAHHRAGAGDHLQRTRTRCSARTASPSPPPPTPARRWRRAASTNGAGNLVTGSVESSNVDIATEFSKLIVAQQAYSANAKMVTTARRQLLQTTIDMKR